MLTPHVNCSTRHQVESRVRTPGQLCGAALFSEGTSQSPIWVLIISNFCFLDNSCKRCFKFLFLHPRDSPCHHSPYLGVHASSREPWTWFLWDFSSSPSALPHQSFPKWSSHFPLSLISGWKKGPGNCHFNKVQPASHRTEKDQFSLQSQRKATPKNVQTTTQLHSSNTLAK